MSFTTDAGIEFATRMDDADMAVEGGAVVRHKRGTTDELATRTQPETSVCGETFR